jgi:DNA polymerase-3 subunit epsilon
MREVVLDTETTGLDPDSGHRVVEIACVELVNHVPTGREYQSYVNPERDMPDDAEGIHGLTAEFLADKPKFAEIAEAFLSFLGEDRLVIHNAEFDMRFLNAELKRLDRDPLARERAVDTVQLARRRYPGAQASLDALCRRFEIDTTERDKHGALIDCRLLARVYLELVGGREPGLEFAALGPSDPEATARAAGASVRAPRPHAPSPAELEAHGRFLDKLRSPIWRS